jgi:hypothetical protein
VSDERDNFRRLWPASVGVKLVKLATPCPGHTASDHDAKVCRYCGTHIDEYRDEPPEAA